ncbi:Fibrillin-1 [Stylophora pistillata]|uniref:Fibrillin-1 n=1 Tax=Stylophora pistillata TaxID=50429 RepID=A0A2B4R6S9_STYPI|nr:Fibrillin-1 [Stylophora pistillata]
MGSFDGAETCELMGSFFQSQLQHLNINVGLYRDDRLAKSDAERKDFADIREQDIGECSQNSHNCSNIPATCNNKKGSFKCSCKPGFSGDGNNCTDIDECAENIHNCSKDNATCSNSKGSFNCSCNPAFSGDGYNCTDIDECPHNIHNCSDITATCSNTVGAFKCVCKPGFTGDEHSCTDIDECLQNHNCSENANCSNTKGSQNCSCYPGFSGYGHKCVDIDESSQNSHNCSYKTATCNNSEGSFKCICKPDSVVMDTTAQTSMSVLTIPITAARAAPLVQTLRDHSTALAILVSLEMDTPAKKLAFLSDLAKQISFIANEEVESFQNNQLSVKITPASTFRL